MLEFVFPLVPYLSFFSMLTSLILMLILSVFSSNDFRKQFGKIKKSTWLILIAIVIFGFYNLSASPNIFTTLHDEYSFGRYAVSLLNGDAGFFESFIGYQIFMSFIFLILGPDLSIIYVINTIFGALSIILVFLVAHMLFGEEEAGLFASLLFALFPLNNIYFNTLECSASVIFFSLLTIFYFLFYFKVKTSKSQFLAALSLAFAVFFRLEFIILPILFGFMVLLFDFSLKKYKSFKHWIPWIVLVILIIPAFLQVLWNIHPLLSEGKHITFSNPDYGIFSLKALSENAGKLNLIFISDLFPPYFVILLFLGLLSLFMKSKKRFIFIVAWISVLMGIYLSYWILWLRHLLPVYMAVIIIWGGGASFVVDIFKKFVHKFLNIKFFNSWVILVVLLLLFVAAYPFAYSLEKKYPMFLFWGAREIYLEREALYFLDQTLGSCTIVMVDDEGLISRDLKPLKIEHVIKNPEILEETTKDGCLLYFEDLYCRVPSVFYTSMEELAGNYTRLCREMHEKFNLTVYKKFNITLPEAYENFRPELIKNDWAEFTLYNVSAG